jgi:hypothetical protein
MPDTIPKSSSPRRSWTASPVSSRGNWGQTRRPGGSAVEPEEFRQQSVDGRHRVDVDPAEALVDLRARQGRGLVGHDPRIFCRPLTPVASIVTRNSGQSCSSPVTSSTVTAVSAPKASS